MLTPPRRNASPNAGASDRESFNLPSPLARAGLVVSLAALALSACASTPRVSPSQPASPTVETGAPEAFKDLPGWANEDHSQAFDAFRQGCAAARDPLLIEVCARARALGSLSDQQAQKFFETRFQPVAVTGSGVLTAYFAPEYEARRQPDATFAAPALARPNDLVISGTGGRDALQRKPAGGLGPYPERAAIEATLPSAPLAWLKAEDLFFLQIQGSGTVTFPDGERMKLAFAATNGRPFSGIANAMRDRGLLAAGNTSGDAIRQWLADHRGQEAAQIMQLNPRYVFFSLAPDDGRPPVGAAGVPLPPGRAIAVDASQHRLGDLYWIDGEAPILTGAFPTYRRLVTALDVGGAIKGQVRADLYLGQGAAAGAEAGRVRHTLKMYRLVPRPDPGA